MADYNSYIEFSATLDTSPPEVVVEPEVDTTSIRVYDTSMNLLGILDNYEYFKSVHNWYTPDTWELRINRYKTNASTLLSGRSLDASGNWLYGGFISRTVNGETWVGMTERIEIPLTPDGKVSEQYYVTGRGVEAILGTRIASYGTDDGDGYDSQNVEGETAMRHYVDVNCIDTSANQIITGLSLYPVDEAKGSVVDFKARFQGIDEVLESICMETGLSYKLHWTGSGLNFVFTVKEGADVSSSVTMSPDFGNVERLNYLNSILDKKNLLYMGGEDEAELRTVITSYSTDSEPAGWARRELFVDARDCSSNDQLTQRAAEMLTELGESLTLEVEYRESNSFVLGTDFNLGDTVTVVYPDIVTMVSRVIMVTEEISPESGLRRTLGIGKAYPDLKSILKKLKKSTSAEVRK